MKRLIILTILLLTLLVVISAKDKGKAEIRFEQSSHNFGTMRQGDPAVTHLFEFSNIGTAPLLITRTTTTCRCVTVESPKRPVKAGQKGVISVTFDPKDKGVFNKTIEVHTNAGGGSVILLITGEVQ